jgi:energy-coupling factor transporter ATP-binding protein EcfA2
VDLFRTTTIAHPILRKVDIEARQAITAPDSKNLVIIYGPTGVGKSTLVARIKRVLDEEIADELRLDTGRAAVPIINAVAPEAPSFRWGSFYLRELRAIEHPFAAEQVRKAGPRPDADQLRTRLENALQIARPPAVIVDEAHHMGVGASPQQLVKTLEIIKSHAEASGTRYVLVGTYSLLAFRNLNGQLSRRSRDIHFMRYGTSPDELGAFRETVVQLGDTLPIPSPALGERWDQLYERTAGCIGILKDWMTQGLALALDEGSARLEWRHLAQTALSVAAMTSIATEIKEGEAALAETSDSRNHLRSMLGLDRPEPAAVRPYKSGARKPGQRKPQRDAVGRRSSTSDVNAVTI